MKLSLHLTIIALLCSWCCSYIHCVCVCVDVLLQTGRWRWTTFAVLASGLLPPDPAQPLSIEFEQYFTVHRYLKSSPAGHQLMPPTRSINRPSRPTIILRITFLWSKEPTFNKLFKKEILETIVFSHSFLVYFINQIKKNNKYSFFIENFSIDLESFTSFLLLTLIMTIVVIMSATESTVLRPIPATRIYNHTNVYSPRYFCVWVRSCMLGSTLSLRQMLLFPLAN